jgi:crotonobetainyl-CoA:carnitine CoA-transferase CaiB-like acyl-CoA transferase
VIEGFRPGVADRLGVGYEAVRAVNPSVVYCSISGYGATGPLAQVPGHDVNYQAYSGVLAPKGGDPVFASLPVGDLGAGMAAAMTTVAACFRARLTGEGERIDVGIADVLATWTGAVGQLTPVGSPKPMDGLPGYGTYRTADDRFVSIGVLVEEHFWVNLCRALDRPDLEVLDLGARIANKQHLDASVATVVSGLALAEVLELLEQHDVPVAPVLDRTGMLELDHFRQRGTVVDVARPGTEAAPAMGHLARYSVHPPRELGPVPEVDDDPTRSWLAR